MALLQGPSAKQAEVIKQELGEGPDDLERGIRDLRSMCAASPHLPRPELLDDQLLSLYVRGCRMDMARARTKFENFCVSRARHRDLYEHRSLNERPLNDVCKFVDILPLPKLTDEGYRVTIFRMRPGYPESAVDVNSLVKAVLLVCDCRMRDEHLIAGDVFVWEVSHSRGSMVTHIASALNTVRRGIQLAHTAYPQRLKRVHVVGAPGFVAASVQLVLNCINEKVRKRFCINSKPEELLDHIPARVLPVEFGGTEDSVDILAKRWRRRVDELRDYLRDLAELFNSTSRPNLNNDIYGVAGAFRKLDID